MYPNSQPSGTELSPLVSVIMPVKDGERFIDEAIRSILEQTLQRLELIVIINGSTDSTLERVQSFARADSRVRVITLQEPNIPNALNTGIINARAIWIARMDADDVALPTRLERQLAFLDQHPEVATLGTWGWRIGEDGKRISPLHMGPTTKEEFTRTKAESEIFLLSTSVVFSRDVARAIGGFSLDYSVSEDIEFWNRIADNHIVLTLPEELVYYRVHRNAISTLRMSHELEGLRRLQINIRRRRNGQEELTLQQFQLLERQRPLHQRIRDRLHAQSRHCYRRGGILLAERNPLGFVWLLESFTLQPFQATRRLGQQQVLNAVLPNLPLYRLIRPRLAQFRALACQPRRINTRQKS